MKHGGAKTRAGGACRRAAMPNGRCSKHGGKSLVGPAAPAFRHGRSSKLLPARLAALLAAVETARGGTGR